MSMPDAVVVPISVERWDDLVEVFVAAATTRTGAGASDAEVEALDGFDEHIGVVVRFAEGTQRGP
jgi:hypothetical protein